MNFIKKIPVLAEFVILIALLCSLASACIEPAPSTSPPPPKPNITNLVAEDVYLYGARNSVDVIYDAKRQTTCYILNSSNSHSYGGIFCLRDEVPAQCEIPIK